MTIDNPSAALEPIISIIIPTCNRNELVLDCIRSILKNDFSNFEVLVIDQDPSQRLKAQLAQHFDDPRIIYYFLNVAALDRARNIGIDQARGHILVFADDDIEVSPVWLNAYLEAFSKTDPIPGVVGGRLDPLWMAKRPIWLPQEHERIFGLYNQDGCDYLTPMIEGHLPIGANFAVLRDVVKVVGNFDDRLDYSYDRKTSMISGGDSLFSLRIKQANYPIYYQPTAKAWHKISKNKLTMSYFLRRTFWEGVTLVIVLHLSGTITRANALGAIHWHIREIARHVWRLFVPRDPVVNNLFKAQSWVRALAGCIHSIGVIYAALKLRLIGRLP